MKFFSGLWQLFKLKRGSDKTEPTPEASVGIKTILTSVVVVILIASGFIAWNIFFSGQEISERQNDTQAQQARFTLTNADKALLKAVRDDDVNTFSRYLFEGGRVDAADNSGVTPVRAAIALNRVNIIRELIASEPGAVINNVYSTLVYAIVQDRPLIVRELMKLSPDVNSFDKNGYTPLLYAVNRNYVNVARELLSAGADVNAPSKEGVSPLIEAVTVGKADMVAELIKAGADIGVLSPSGETAMNIARRRSQQIIVALLAEAEAPPETITYEDYLELPPSEGKDNDDS